MANNVRAWSTTAASNGTADVDINAAEGCPPSAVNDDIRYMMAKVKNTLTGIEYLDHGYTCTFVSASSFASPGDLRAIYLARRRMKFDDATTLYGTIQSVSYVAVNTTVTMVMDSTTTLTSALTAGYIGIQAPTNLSAPANFNKEAYATTAGTSTAYTAAFTPKNVALDNGVCVRVKLHTTCGAAPTIAVDGLAAKSISKPGNVAVAANDLIANSVLALVYDSTLDVWIIEGVSTPPAPATPYTIKTANYTAVTGDNILADTTSTAWTLTMPTSPANTDAPIVVKKLGQKTLTIDFGAKSVRMSNGQVVSGTVTIDGWQAGDFSFAYRGTDAGGQTNEWSF